MQHTDLGKASQARNSHRPLMASGSIKQFRPSQELSEVHFESTELAVPQARLEEELRIYEWRIKTEFPIVRIYDCSFLDERKGRSHLSIKLEKFPLRLSQLTDLPLFKTLYLLKESIIGFERLFAKFGAFPVTPRMVGLNQQNKCKVWLNESLANNSHITMPIEESAFLRQVVRAIEPSSNKLKNTSHFFG